MNEQIKNIVTKIYDDLKKHPVNHSALMSGKAGICLFNFFYEQYFNDEASTLENDVQQIAEENIIFSNTDFANGKAGTDWFLKYLANKNALDKEDTDFFCAKENELEKTALEHLEKGNYDFLHGAIGIAWTLLYQNKKSNILFFEKFYKALFILQKKSNSKNIIPYYDPFAKEIKSNHVNLGLAHGIPSILKFCIQCIKQNICAQEATLLSKKIIEYLLQHTNADKTKSFFSSKIIDNKISDEQSRLAWCYGDLGIAHILYESSIILTDNIVSTAATEILEHASKRKTQEETLVKDACICHGSAGLAYMYLKLYNLMGEKFLKEAFDFWLNETLKAALFDDGIAGFKTFSPLKNNYIKNAGLLEGAAGIGLMMMSFLTNDFSWDYCLMLNE